MSAISLPEIPLGTDFEEFICAHLQGAGLYTDRSIIDRGKAEILELDIITTDYQKDAAPALKLLEVKSAGWGFAEVFKVKGWMTYLKIDNAAFVVMEKKEQMDYYVAKARELGISLILVEDVAQAQAILSENFGVPEVKTTVRDIWRYSYLAERKLIGLLKQRKKAMPQFKCYKALDDYLFAVNSRTFFSRNILRRVQTLYSEFQKTPNVSAKCIHELAGEAFEEDYDLVPEPAFKQAYYTCEFNELAITTFVEHRARLSILKGAVDYILHKRAGNAEIADQVTRWDIFGTTIEWSLLDVLPKTFREGVLSIADDPYFHRYPVFWQWFMWFFGGFILKDCKDNEFELMSQMTGIPIEEIPRALAAYDKVFPMGGGWFFDLGDRSHIEVLRLFPVPFFGIGANARRILYGVEKYDQLPVKGQYTIRDLGKWNNVALAVLTL